MSCQPPSSLLLTKQKVRTDASNAIQEAKPQSKLSLLQVSGTTVLYADGLCLNGTHHKRLLINYTQLTLCINDIINISNSEIYHHQTLTSSRKLCERTHWHIFYGAALGNTKGTTAEVMQRQLTTTGICTMFKRMLLFSNQNLHSCKIHIVTCIAIYISLPSSHNSCFLL